MIQPIERSVRVSVSARAAYEQWSRFDLFPALFPGAERVERLDENRVLWRAPVVGRVREWVSEISEVVPYERVEWRTRFGSETAGAATFLPVAEGRSVVRLRLEYEPQSFQESLVYELGLGGGRVSRALAAFKRLAEERVREANSLWRALPSGGRRDRSQRRPKFN